jgi:hypothetical protein
VHGYGAEIDATRPLHAPKIVIDCNCVEDGWVEEAIKDSTLTMRLDRVDAFDTVRKANPEIVVFDGLGFDDADH